MKSQNFQKQNFYHLKPNRLVLDSINTKLSGIHILVIVSSFFWFSSFAQNIKFEYEKASLNSGFKMEGYWVWCGSMLKVDSTYHLFASRWPKEGAFPEGYRNGSEIIRATSKSPMGPFAFQEVIIGERDSSFWDSNMAHNPTVYKINDKYVLFYIGSDFTSYQKNTRELLRRVGYAESYSINGPWVRSEKPLLDFESNNPSVLVDGSNVKIIFRDRELKVFLAEAPNYKGPFSIVNKNLWPSARIEDFYLFKSQNKYHIVCEDNTGAVCGHERWGIHLYSKDGVSNWMKYNPLIAYNHDILLENDSVLHCVRRERPQFLIENNKIIYLITAIYDGSNSWSQPVKLKHPIKLD